MQSFESSSESGLYHEWLRDRGLGETPVVETTGVFLRDISPERPTLLVSHVAASTAAQDIELLKRLANAIGSDVSIVAVPQHSAIPWNLVFDLHSSLQTLIVLGCDAKDQLHRSGYDARLPAQAIITGATPDLLSQDIAAKRELWQKIQQRFR